MATYRRYFEVTNPILNTTEERLATQEFDIYGSKRTGVLNSDQIISYRVGVWSSGAFVPGTPADFTVNSYSSVFPDVYGWDVGNKSYELSNHLGNVLVTITDRKVPNISSGSYTYFSAQVTTVADYYPFGMQIEERTWQVTGSYRFGFNGQEKETDIAGDGDYLAFTHRVHDARLGRFLSVDPVAKNYPWNSPYAFAENDVIQNLDLEGLEKLDFRIYLCARKDGSLYYYNDVKVTNPNGQFSSTITIVDNINGGVTVVP